MDMKTNFIKEARLVLVDKQFNKNRTSQKEFSLTGKYIVDRVSEFLDCSIFGENVLRDVVYSITYRWIYS